jgi:nuclear pore complex protein Nup205
MAANDSLEGLQGLHRDLLSLSENRLPAVERLLDELDNRIAEFRSLLDKTPKSDTSRRKLSSGAYLALECVCGC